MTFNGVMYWLGIGMLSGVINMILGLDIHTVAYWISFLIIYFLGRIGESL